MAKWCTCMSSSCCCGQGAKEGEIHTPTWCMLKATVVYPNPDERIQALEARIKELEAEIARLKQGA